MLQPWHRVLQGFVASASVLLHGTLAPALAQDPPRANVLLLLADDVGIDKLGCYQPGTNPPPPKTPVIDALAAKGVRFTQAYANPLCSPTRACMQTGRYGFRTGIGTLVRGNNTAIPMGPMSPSEFTLPEMLDAGASGYAHAAIGKWHLGYHQSLGVRGDPLNHGYGWFAGTKGNFSPGMVPPQRYEDWQKTVNGATEACKKFATVDNVDEALAFIATKKSAPWFCHVGFNAAHTPLYRPPGSSLPNATPASGEAWWPYLNAMIEHLDSEIGRLLAELEKLDRAMLARTLVIFTSDNGSWSAPSGPMQMVFPPFDPARCKTTVFEGGVRVPLVASGYLVEAPGRTSAALVHSVDFFATVAAIAGVDLARPKVIPAGRTLDSQSFLPILTDAAAQGTRTHVFCETFDVNNPAPGTKLITQRSLRDARYKLVRLSDAAPPRNVQMYDLARDPFETEDLLQREGGPTPAEQEAFQALSARLDALLGSG